MRTEFKQAVLNAVEIAFKDHPGETLDLEIKINNVQETAYLYVTTDHRRKLVKCYRVGIS